MDSQECHNDENGKEKNESGCHHHENLSGSYQENKEKILQSLRRIEGQVRGIHKMVEEERYCADVLNQVAAARMALAQVGLTILEDHTKGCVSEAIKEENKKEEIIDELMEIIKRFT